MTQRIAAIELKIPDNTAFTALVALRRLGIDVESVRRSEIWQMEDAGDSQTFAQRVRANSAIFNPNKHRLIVLDDARPRAGEAWVERRQEGNEVREHLGGKGIAGVTAARRCVGWQLTGAAGRPVRPETLRAAVEGLLCNPAIEKAVYQSMTEEY